jgi:hypothetical protein
MSRISSACVGTILRLLPHCFQRIPSPPDRLQLGGELTVGFWLRQMETAIPASMCDKQVVCRQATYTICASNRYA